MLLKRVYDKEIMDDFSIQDERIDTALHELDVINKISFGNFLSKQGIRVLKRKYKLSFPVVLDVGGGSSTILTKNKVKIINYDLNIRAAKYANEHHGLPAVNGDVFTLPFKDSSVDLIHCSLFLHHFNEDEISLILNEFKRVAKYGVIINDLHRAVIPLLFVAYASKLFSKSAMVKSDGPLSIRKGFIRSELRQLMRPYSKKYKLYWLLYRWLIIIYLYE